MAMPVVQFYFLYYKFIQILQLLLFIVFDLIHSKTHTRAPRPSIHPCGAYERMSTFELTRIKYTIDLVASFILAIAIIIVLNEQIIHCCYVLLRLCADCNYFWMKR